MMDNNKTRDNSENRKFSNKSLYELAIAGYFKDKKLTVSPPVSSEQEIGNATLDSK